MSGTDLFGSVMDIISRIKSGSNGTRFVRQYPGAVAASPLLPSSRLDVDTEEDDVHICRSMGQLSWTIWAGVGGECARE